MSYKKKIQKNNRFDRNIKNERSVIKFGGERFDQCVYPQTHI